MISELGLSRASISGLVALGASGFELEAFLATASYMSYWQCFCRRFFSNSKQILAKILSYRKILAELSRGQTSIFSAEKY